MDLNKKTYRTVLHGEDLSIEVSALAGQANAAVFGKWGGTTVLATAVMSKLDKGGDFFPLTVDYEERFYAAGKILGSKFVRRENRPTDEAILSARLIDRTIRPLFDHRLRREVQIVVTVLTYDERHDPDVIGLIAVSTALGISDIPWNGPVGGAKYAQPDGEKGKGYRAFFAGPKGHINMIEFEGKEVPKEVALQAFAEGERDIAALVDFQEKIIADIGKPKADVHLGAPDEALVTKVREFTDGKIEEAIRTKTIEHLKELLFASLTADGADEATLRAAEQIFETEFDTHVHVDALKNNRRPDGRAFDEIRDLHAEIAPLPLTHGSGLFIRGTTQVLAVATLDSLKAEQLVESMEGLTAKRFMLHYNFPKFATGETGKGGRGPGRREIGHGALAAKAVSAMIPPKEEFPYAIRIVAETLSSNGSSSQASTCAASLALMDAGVPIKRHVAGIAIGLMLEENGDGYKILTDIQGPEDHYGDMDFKVAGTREGLTAIQMDVKVRGITKKIFEEALVAGEKARIQILDVMERAIPAPRPEVSEYAPKVSIIHLPEYKIGEVIGSGGKNIQGLIAAVGGEVTIDIEDDGTTYITGVKKDLVERTIKSIEAIIKEYEVGEVVTGPVVKILEFGAIVDLGGGNDGMIHVSELKEGFVDRVEDVLKLGEVVTAKVVKIDRERGKIGLSLKAMKS
jgi:polyribonucleotide nucleotidyltransferase